MSSGVSNEPLIISTEAILKTRVASFVSNMNARPDCELPNYLARLGDLLLMGNDALGWRTLIEGLR